MTDQNGPRKDRHFVTALARGLHVVSAFRRADRALSNRELAERTGLPRPTVARFTHTLERLSYLTAHRETGRYSLAPRTIELGQTGWLSVGIRDIVRPGMQGLSELGNIAVSLGISGGTYIRYLEMVRRPEAIVLNLEPGACIPVPQTAIGRAWLAALGATSRERAIAALKADDPELWRSGEEPVMREIARFADRGYTESLGEWWPEINAVATAVRLPGDGESLLLNIGGLSSVLPLVRLEAEFAPALLDAAHIMQARLARLFRS